MEENAVWLRLCRARSLRLGVKPFYSQNWFRSQTRHPMPSFEFATAARILFGEGTVRQVPAAAASFGRRALLVTGASPDRALPLQNALDAAGVSTVPFPVPGEPTLDLIRSAPRDCDFVIAFGGGSALDAAKAARRPAHQPRRPLGLPRSHRRRPPPRPPRRPLHRHPHHRRHRQRSHPQCRARQSRSIASKPACAARRCSRASPSSIPNSPTVCRPPSLPPPASTPSPN